MPSQFAVLSQEHHETMQATDSLLDAAIKEGRDLTDEERVTVEASESRLDELDSILSVERRQRALRKREAAGAEGQQPGRFGPEAAALAQGRQFVRSLAAEMLADPQFAAWRAQMTPNGRTRGGVHIDSPRVDFGALAPLRLGSATSAGALTVPDDYGLVPLALRPLGVRNLVTNATTGSDAVDYARITGFTNAAAPVQEAPDITGTPGLKPQSDMAFERVSTAVKTIATWVAATRQALADAGQLESLINSLLLYFLELVLEDQMINGDATGENLDGILHVAGTLSQAFVTDLFRTTRKARTLLRLQGYVTPSGYLFHPADLEELDLLQDNEARYFFGGPTSMGQRRLWGVPVVESESVPAGTAILADWRYAVLWDREQGAIQISDSHADFFVRNLVAIRAELRAAFGVLMPKAFVKIALS